MFLVDSALAGSDWDGVMATIKNVLQKAEVEILWLQKWAEKKLAYEINHKARGTYILCYFRADGSRIRDIERDVRLSERIMRVLILRADKHMAEHIERQLSQSATRPADQSAAAGPPLGGTPEGAAQPPLGDALRHAVVEAAPPQAEAQPANSSAVPLPDEFGG
jgi:small subunit ribosomal protein S6